MSKRESVVYESDGSQLKGEASAVIFPESIAEIQRIVRAAGNVDVVARGGGSGLMGGCVPRNSIVLDLSKMDKIFDIDMVKKIAYVEAGVILDELKDALELLDLDFAVDTLSSGVCTIGGMIATNACGGRSMKYGKMNRQIDSLEVVDGEGNLKNISMADVSDYAGMEGITGIIVSAKLKVIDKKERSVSVFQSDSIDEVLDLANKLKLKSEVSMIEFLDRKISSLMGLKYRYHLLIEFESDVGKMKGAEYERIMQLKKNIYKTVVSNDYFIFGDCKIFFDKVKDMIIYLEEKNIPFFVHLGEGIVHGFFKNEKEREETLKEVKKLRGLLSGCFGIGLIKKDYLDDSEKNLISRVKARCDFHSRLNRGKMIDYIMEDRIEVEEKAESLVSEENILEDKQVSEEQKAPEVEEKQEKVEEEKIIEKIPEEIEKEIEEVFGKEVIEVVEETEDVVEVEKEIESPDKWLNIGGNEKEKIGSLVSEEQGASEIDEKQESLDVSKKNIEDIRKEVSVNVQLVKDKLKEKGLLVPEVDEGGEEIKDEDEKIDNYEQRPKQESNVETGSYVHKRETMSKEEEEEVKKIASGFFGGKN